MYLFLLLGWGSRCRSASHRKGFPSFLFLLLGSQHGRYCTSNHTSASDGWNLFSCRRCDSITAGKYNPCWGSDGLRDCHHVAASGKAEAGVENERHL